MGVLEKYVKTTRKNSHKIKIKIKYETFDFLSKEEKKKQSIINKKELDVLNIISIKNRYNFISLNYNLRIKIKLSRRVSTKWPSSVFEINNNFFIQHPKNQIKKFDDIAFKN
ncbi:hypothetical protein BpHYR1_047727 [Brachionus plicatilis]|uniref:Uncharacterized protein n=1 Tax=Brachionus plicatilis TaxID=10195 RepID=A0A3M7P028_BRAPC|nr:hypothetical protein BpHYR1_047727 [Brachionus plicatilis]